MNQIKLELNTVLMKSTFKLVGEGSIGTAFIIGRPSKKSATYHYYVMVTAAHVLEEIRGSHATLFLRKKNQGYQKFPHEFEIRREAEPLWVRHPKVDVAVLYVSLPSAIDIELLPTRMLADDKILKKIEIHPGDELMCLGYPLGAEATEAGFPILRSGKIASYPLIPTKETKTFLYDFRIFPGNSGGPVYFAESKRIAYLRAALGAIHPGPIQFVAGLVTEELIVPEEIKSLYENKHKRHKLSLAKVVHASLIKETIDMLPMKP